MPGASGRRRSSRNGRGDPLDLVARSPGTAPPRPQRSLAEGTAGAGHASWTSGPPDRPPCISRHERVRPRLASSSNANERKGDGIPGMLLPRDRNMKRSRRCRPFAPRGQPETGDGGGYESSLGLNLGFAGSPIRPPPEDPEGTPDARARMCRLAYLAHALMCGLLEIDSRSMLRSTSSANRRSASSTSCCRALLLAVLVRIPAKTHRLDHGCRLIPWPTRVTTLTVKHDHGIRAGTAGPSSARDPAHVRPRKHDDLSATESRETLLPADPLAISTIHGARTTSGTTLVASPTRTSATSTDRFIWRAMRAGRDTSRR